MDRKEIYQKIIDLSNDKNKHLREHAEHMDRLAKINSSMIFVTGECDECTFIEIQIADLEIKLKRM